MSDLLPDLHIYLHDKIPAQKGLYKNIRSIPQNDLSIESIDRSIHPSDPDTLDTSISNTSTPNYLLKWRQRKLIVQFLAEPQQFSDPAVDEQEWLITRLQNSPVKLVKLDLALGETCLRTWAEACHHTARKAFLRLPAAPDRPQNKKPLPWWLKRRLDWMIAAMLLGVLSPALLSLAILLSLESPEPTVVRQWCVGERGRLFQCFRFRTSNSANLTDLGQWMSKLKLDRLPMLLNVLRGEMSLVGSHPFDLGSAIQVNLESRCCLNLLPGIVGIQPIQQYLSIGDSKSLSSHDRYQDDCDYLQGWSLEWDLKFLLMVIPKLILTLSTD